MQPPIPSLSLDRPSAHGLLITAHHTTSYQNPCALARIYIPCSRAQSIATSSSLCADQFCCKLFRDVEGNSISAAPKWRCSAMLLLCLFLLKYTMYSDAQIKSQ